MKHLQTNITSSILQYIDFVSEIYPIDDLTKQVLPYCDKQNQDIEPLSV
jgi:hypothetical protein